MDFVRQEWWLFRNVQSLAQHAGVFEWDIPPLVVKELVDNALDESENCTYDRLEDGKGFYVENPGDGFKGTNEEIAQLFSISRPLMTTKYLRLPTRGRLGNGLRMVSGAVLSLGGTLVLKSAGRILQLVPRDNGTTEVKPLGPWPHQNTRIEITLPNCRLGSDLFQWADRAQALKGGVAPLQRSSLLWYDSDGFYELLQAAKGFTVRQLIECFEGCSGKNAARLSGAFTKRSATSLDREEAERLLKAGRSASEPIKLRRLGAAGKDAFPDRHHYVVDHGSFHVEPKKGTFTGTIPFVIELWVRPPSSSQQKPHFLVHVNRSPIVNAILCTPSGRRINIIGCGLNGSYAEDVGLYDFWLNVQTPYLPLWSNSKSPDLTALNTVVFNALEKSIGKGKKSRKRQEDQQKSKKDFILGDLDRAIEKASGSGTYRYSLRQLFYAVRPKFLLQFKNAKFDYGWFCQVVSDYEMKKQSDLPGIYRDNRGTLYHPHTRENIPLGTLAVENYKRPAWTFNKILYCEKEGFFPILIDSHWPERNDCAILTSKGFASKAARDVLDLMGKSKEPLTFFCIHDADGPGTMIYEALQAGTPARQDRHVQIVNLGLDPQEALAMDLDVETFSKKKKVPVASYISDEDTTWLQTHRVELNAMDTPTFLNWLDMKLQPHHNGKIIPPVDILDVRLRSTVQETLKERIRFKLLEEVGFADHVNRAVQSIDPDITAQRLTLADRIASFLSGQHNMKDHWSQPLDGIAGELVQNFLSRNSHNQ